MKATTPRATFVVSIGLVLAVACVASIALAASNTYVIKSWDYPAPGNTNRLFIGAAVGDFNDDAVAEMAVIKRAHSQIIILRSAADATYETKAALDVDLTNNQLIGVAAGNLNAAGPNSDSRDELIVLRNAPSAGLSNLLVYRFGQDQDWSSSLVTQTRVGNGNEAWKGVASGDFDGNGRMDIAVVSEGANSRMYLYELSTSDTLVLKVNHGWIGSMPLTSIGAGDLDGDGRSEIVVARQASGSSKDFLFQGRG